MLETHTSITDACSLCRRLCCVLHAGSQGLESVWLPHSPTNCCKSQIVAEMVCNMRCLHTSSSVLGTPYQYAVCVVITGAAGRVIMDSIHLTCEVQ